MGNLGLLINILIASHSTTHFMRSTMIQSSALQLDSLRHRHSSRLPLKASDSRRHWAVHLRQPCSRSVSHSNCSPLLCNLLGARPATRLPLAGAAGWRHGHAALGTACPLAVMTPAPGPIVRSPCRCSSARCRGLLRSKKSKPAVAQADRCYRTSERPPLNNTRRGLQARCDEAPREQAR